MIELFANSVAAYIGDNYKLPANSCLSVSPDSENAIVFQEGETVIYYKIAAHLESKQIELHEVILNKNLDLKSDQCYYYLTVNEAVDHITDFILKH